MTDRGAACQCRALLTEPAAKIFTRIVAEDSNLSMLRARFPHC